MKKLKTKRIKRIVLGRGLRGLASRGISLAIVGVIIATLLPASETSAQILSQGPNSPNSSTDCTDDATIGSTTWTNPGNAAASDATYVSASVNSANPTHYVKCLNYGFSIPTSATIIGVKASINRMSSSTSGSGDQDNAVRLVKGGTIGTTDRSTSTLWPTTAAYEDHGSATDLWGTTLTPSDVNASNFGVAVSGKRNGGGSHTLSVDHIQITVYYEHHSQVAMTGYIWENDDEDNAFGDAYDENTQQAAGNTAISDVAIGERLTLRMQLKNTGSAALNDLALFFDRGDGIWTKAQNAKPTTTSGTGCISNEFNCTTVDNRNGNIWSQNSIVLDSTGNPWLSYGDTNELRVARYVGSGGNCDDTGGSDAWQCTTVNNAGIGGGEYASIALDSSDNPWVSFFDQVNSNLKVARYVGSGGTGCTSTAWTCTTIDATDSIGDYTSIAIDPAGIPWIGYRNGTASDLKVARYVGSGGNCDLTGGSDAWQCTSVDTGGFVVAVPSIAFDPTGTAWVSYTYNINDLRVARYVGSGGTGCADAAWTCVAVETAGDVGNESSIAFDPAGNPWISHYDINNDNLRIARYVGSGGTGCASSAWTDCSIIDATGDVGANSSIVFGPGGSPLVSYYDLTNTDIKLATYVGSGGNCDDTGGSDAWMCTIIDDTVNDWAGDEGEYSSIAINSTGDLWISYSKISSISPTVTTQQRVAKLVSRAGEIAPSPSPAALAGNSLNESHTDMTSVSDTANRDDVDCTGGGTWNNGRITTREEISNLGLPIGSGTAQCTEVAFMIDTSNAIAGTTYRFAVATKDAWRIDQGTWRGPISISAYPSMTISSTAPTSRYTKDVLPKFADCTNTDWGCQQIEDPGWSGNTSIAIDGDGNPWVASIDDTNISLRVAHYLGGATTGTGCSVNTWTCVLLESNGVEASYSPSIAIGPSGNPWISYYDPVIAGLKVTRYENGTFTTTIVDSPNVALHSVGQHSSLAFDQYGTAWVSYYDITSEDLRLARYVGTGGTGCYSTAWTCTTIVSTNIVGTYSSLAFDSQGNPWIAYMEGATTSCNDSPTTECSLAIARYVGTGGTGCAVSTWTCTIIDNPSTTGMAGDQLSMVIDSNDKIWISYLATTSGLKVAEYLNGATTGTGCSVNTWKCVGLYSIATGQPRIALDSEGMPWISYYRSGLLDLHVARYLGADATTGNICSVQTWNCEVIMESGAMGNGSSIAFDYSGTPWIATRNNSNGSFWVVRRHLSPVKLSAKPINNYSNVNAPRSEGRYRLSSGLSPRSTSTCAGLADLLGLCGVSTDDSNFDSITATNARPMFTFTVKNSSPASVPTITWVGRSNIAPSTGGTTGDLMLQVYNHTTHAWDTVVTDSASTDCNTVDCSLIGSVPDVQQYSYYEGDSSGSYWLHVRVWQYENTSAETLKTDYFNVGFENTGSQLRGGNRFLNGLESGFDL